MAGSYAAANSGYKQFRSERATNLNNAPSLPNTERTQLNTRIDSALNQAFTVECRAIGKDKSEVIEMLVELWLHQKDRRSHWHLDGVECPLSALITTITTAVQLQISERVKASITGTADPHGPSNHGR